MHDFFGGNAKHHLWPGLAWPDHTTIRDNLLSKAI